jgi:hypothetical protein
MGINIGTATLLAKTNMLNAVKRTSSDNTCSVLMQGRQWMSTQKKDFAKLSKYNSNLRASSLEKGCFAEPFLTDLGATSIESLDYSDFEGASLIHNLNEPLSQNPSLEESRGKYDLVLDFGTSEHVFQPAQSIANSISLLKVGGKFSCTLPISCWLEHGFYQFSPTFFSSLQNDSLKLDKMYIYQPYIGQLEIWDALSMPNCSYYDRIKARISCWAVYTKTAEMDEKAFIYHTQQGVYSKEWKGHEESISGGAVRNNSGALFNFKNMLIKKSRFIQFMYMKHKRINISQVAAYDV